MDKGSAKSQLKTEKEFEIRVWEIADIDKVNDQLDEALEKDGYPFGIAVDIKYECISIEKDGTLKLKANFQLDESMVQEIPDLPKGITAITLKEGKDVEKLHNALADALGEENA